MCEHFQNFSLFPITSFMVGDWCEAMNTGKPAVHSDAQSERSCCRECQCMCFPCALTFDIVSFPFRGIYSFTKYSCEKCTECKQGKLCVCAKSTIEPTVSSQPIKDLEKNIINIAPK